MLSFFLSGVSESFSVDFQRTSLCQVPDALLYVADYLCTDDLVDDMYMLNPNIPENVCSWVQVSFALANKHHFDQHF